MEALPQAHLVQFYDDQIEAFWDDTSKEIRVSCRRITENLGTDWKTQHRKLLADEIFSQHLSMVIMTTEAGGRETVTLPLRLIPLWLCTINVLKVRAEIRQKLLLYRQEAADVLAQHFLGIPLPVASEISYAAP